MPDEPPRSFLGELKRRRVVRVAIAYLAAAWLVVEASSTVLPALHAPGWTVTAIVVAALLGLPVALVLGWLYDIDEEGIHRTTGGPRVGAPARTASVAGGLVVVAALAAATLFTVRWLNRPPGGDSRVGLAVFPFRPDAGARSGLGEGVADLLATAVDGTPGFRVADPWSLWRPLRPRRDAPARSPDNRQEAEQLAGRAGAGAFVLGTLVRPTANRLDLSVRIYGMGRGQPLSLSVSGAADSLAALVDGLAIQLITWLGGRADSQAFHGLESRMTHDPDALKAYMDARVAMRRGMIDSANTAIDRALALDSTFGPAYAEAVGIKSWLQYARGERYSGLMPLAERAVALSGTLSERNRLGAIATLASLKTDGVQAADSTRRILELDSTDMNAWASLAYYDLVYGWQYGATAEDALDASEHAVRLDSTFAPALVMRAYLAATVEGDDALRHQVARLRGADTSTVLVRGALLAARAVLADDTTFAVTLDSIAHRPMREWVQAVRFLRLRSPDRTAELLNAAHTAGSDTRAALGRLWIAEGRIQAVSDSLDAGAYDARGNAGTIRRFLLAASIAGVGDSAVAARAAVALARQTPPDSAQAYFETRPVWWNGWLLGAYNATFGDTATARRWQRVLGTLPAGGTPEDYRGALQADIEARLATRHGDLARARHAEEEAMRLWSIHTENDWEAMPSPAIRFHLASLERAAGDDDAAARLLSSLVPPTTWMGFYSALAAYTLGEIEESRGQTQQAVSHYAFAQRYWEHGDDAVAQWRTRAETALERLTGETSVAAGTLHR
jgi:tetratricopeptide (TPR) repeat protein